MKAVMISIRPEWCEKIAHGKKTIEVRKTKPKLETPFKGHIYCTKEYPVLWKDGAEIFVGDSKYNWLLYTPDMLNGKVIGEFVCDRIITDSTYGHNTVFNTLACLTPADAASYCVNPEMYGWHISELKIYDKPKELSEFRKPCIYGDKDISCFLCEKSGYNADMHIDCFNYCDKAPQSWCYVEGVYDNG